MPNNIGLYLHIPFCKCKCAYCDFYSFAGGEEIKEQYTTALCRAIQADGVRFCANADTLYIGGGTPTMLSAAQLCRIIEAAKAAFGQPMECTVEANPADDLYPTFVALAAAGVNRVSLGVQSAVPEELAVLGRRHNNAQVVAAVEAARQAGIENLSLDIMLGLPHQTIESLNTTLDFCLKLNPQHVSAYMLKLEEGTPLAQMPRANLCLPNEDATAALYLHTVERLEQAGLIQYEVSNFAKQGYQSQHNLKYWLGQDYVGIGPAAHSCVGGKRFFYPKDIKGFVAGNSPKADTADGGLFEYLMLRLRLRQGVAFAEVAGCFGVDLQKQRGPLMAMLAKNGLAEYSATHFCLTAKGFLVSNAIILKITE